MPLTPEQKAKWIADLRASPPQARGYLKTDKARCCIGVGYEAITGLIIPLDHNNNDIIYTDNAAQIIGLTVEQRCALVERNDKLQWSFSEIADWIEENL